MQVSITARDRLAGDRFSILFVHWDVNGLGESIKDLINKSKSQLIIYRNNNFINIFENIIYEI